MDLVTINEELNKISKSMGVIAGLANDKLDTISKTVDLLMGSDNKAILYGNKKVENFEDIIKKCLEILNDESQIKKYVQNLRNEDKVKNESERRSDEEISDLVKARRKIISALVSKIERMGHMNTAVTKIQEQYKAEDIDSEIDNSNSELEKANEYENDKITIINNFLNEINKELELIKLINRKAELSTNITNLSNEISNLENRLKNTTLDPSVIDDLTSQKNEAEQKYQAAKDEHDAIAPKIGSNTKGKIIASIKTKINKSVMNEFLKDEIKKAIESEDPKKALDNLKNNSQDKINLNKQIIERRKNRSTELSSGRKLIKDKDDPAEKSKYSLNDNEINEQENLAEEWYEKYKNGEIDDDEEGMKIKNQIEEILNEHNKPIPTDKKKARVVAKEQRKEIREWLDSKKGKTKNPFKKAFRNVQSRIQSHSSKARESYIDEKILDDLKGRFLKTATDIKYKEVTRGARESEAETEKTWRETLLFKLDEKSDDELKEFVEAGKWGKNAREVNRAIVEKNTQQLAEDIEHGY